MPSRVRAAWESSEPPALCRVGFCLVVFAHIGKADGRMGGCETSLARMCIQGYDAEG